MDGRTCPRLAAAALLLTACASGPPDAGAVGLPPARDLHLDVRLASGERIPGGGADQEIALFADGGRTALRLSRVRSVTSNGDAETVTVRLSDGTVRRGVLETESIDVLAPGATSPTRVPTSRLRALVVTPRIRISGSGDAWWDLSLVNAGGFEAENADGRLALRGIEPEVTSPGNGGQWSTVRLARDVGPLGDFACTVSFAWGAAGTGPRAMQNLYVTLLDPQGQEIVCAGHHDAWDQTTGSRYSRLGGRAQESGYGTQPADGCAELRIVRTGEHLQVLWNGGEMRAGESRAPVGRVVVQADFYPYKGWDGESVFGTETLERLEIR